MMVILYDTEAQIDHRRIVLRSQHHTDLSRFNKIVRRGQKRHFTAEMVGDDLVLVPTEVTVPKHLSAEPIIDEVSRLQDLDEAKLREIAAERGVAWDEHAARPQMIVRIARASVKKSE